MAGLSCVMLGAVHSFAYWTVAGLETTAFTLAVTAALFYYLRRSYLAGPWLVMATLLRPEGGLAFVFVILYELISRRTLSKYLLSTFFIYFVTLLPLAVFKIFYFNSLLPNPFYAKTNFGMSQILNGLEYIWLFIDHYLIYGALVLPILIVYKKWNSSIITLTVFFLVYSLYIIIIGGDVLKVHRFFVPLFPVISLIIIYGLKSLIRFRIIVVVLAAGVITWQVYRPMSHITVFHTMENGLSQKMSNIIPQLMEADKSNFSLAVSTIGLVGYQLMGHNIIDLLGLTDSTIARHPEPPISGLVSTWKETNYNSEYLLSRQPDYILFSTGNKPSAPAERALFLYSQFLNNYRPIAFYFLGYIHDIFKRYYPIEGEIVRDVDPQFVQIYNEAINHWSDREYKDALEDFNRAKKYSPKPEYSYLYYYIADSYRKMGNFEMGYELLKIVADMDSLLYISFRDLYLFEYTYLNNPEMAEHYKKTVKKLVPWYIPRLEATAESYKKQIDRQIQKANDQKQQNSGE
jgi:hypothetical protein